MRATRGESERGGKWWRRRSAAWEGERHAYKGGLSALRGSADKLNGVEEGRVGRFMKRTKASCGVSESAVRRGSVDHVPDYACRRERTLTAERGWHLFGWIGRGTGMQAQHVGHSLRTTIFAYYLLIPCCNLRGGIRAGRSRYGSIACIWSRAGGKGRRRG